MKIIGFGLVITGAWLLQKLIEEWYEKGYEKGYKDGLYQNVIRYSEEAD